MSLKISDFKNLDKNFGDVIEEMNNGILNLYLDKNCKSSLQNLEDMLDNLSKTSNVEDLIKHYKRYELKDHYRLNSLISEVKAGYFLSYCLGYSVNYVGVDKTKTPDIETEIYDRKTFVEVKLMDERTFEYHDLQKEYGSRNISYDIEAYIQNKVLSAKDVLDEIENNIPSKVTTSYKDAKFKYGIFRIKQKAHSKPYLYPTISERLPQSKKEKEESSDSYISMEEIENSIIGDLDNAMAKFNEFSDNSDFCFVFIDNHDIMNFGNEEMRKFLYAGKNECILEGGKIIPIKSTPIPEAFDAQKTGWSDILFDLDFLTDKIDYSSKEGWYLYDENAKYLNGVFHCSRGRLDCENVFCFLNPFVIKERNYPKFEKILKYFRE